MVLNINYTLNNGLCLGCGICQGACPSDAIEFTVVNGEFRPVVDDTKCHNKNGCHRCYTACPGLGINLIDTATKLYGSDKVKGNRFIGRFIQCYTGYSNDKDLRYHAASGGVLSQFLIWLLENKYVDGAVVTKFDKQSDLKVKVFIATTPEEIRLAKSSKYAPVTFNTVAKDIKSASGTRYVVVGLPCHIEGIRKLMGIDRTLQGKIVGLFALYCSGTRTYNFTEYLLKSRGIEMNKVDYLSYRDNGCLGGMVIKGDGINYYEDYQRYSHPLRTIFFPRRCLLCADHFGELADICFGDIHVKPFSDDRVGINSVVVRNDYWHEKLKQACEAGAVTLDKLDEDVLLSSQKMSKVKKNRNIAFGLLIKKLGGEAPDYGNTYGSKINLKIAINYMRMSIERYIGRHRSLWWVIPYIKSNVNFQ